MWMKKMKELDKMKEKYESGEYIALWYGDKSHVWCIEKDPSFIKGFKWQLIHKKHKHILDAYLKDNSVDIEIYGNVNNEWKSLIGKDWIDGYMEEFKYRLKPKQQTSFNKYGFETPDFEGEIWKKIKCPNRNQEIVLGYYLRDTDKNTKEIECSEWNANGVCLVDGAKYNLTPLKKNWYDKKESYPVLMFRGECETVRAYHKSQYELLLKQGYILAKNEEILSLLIEGS